MSKLESFILSEENCLCFKSFSQLKYILFMLWAPSEVTVSYFYLEDQSCHIAQSNHSALLSKLEIQILHFPFMAAKTFEDNTTIVPLYFYCSIVNDDVITSYLELTGQKQLFKLKPSLLPSVGGTHTKIMIMTIYCSYVWKLYFTWNITLVKKQLSEVIKVKYSWVFK